MANKEDLIKELKDFQDKYYVKACAWFMEEIAKISKEYGVHMQNYGTLNVSEIGGEKRNFFSGDKVYDEIWDKMYDLHQTLEYEMGYKHLSWEYSDEKKFIQ